MNGKKNILSFIGLFITSFLAAMDIVEKSDSREFPDYVVQFFHPGAYVVKNTIFYIDAEDGDIVFADYPSLKDGYEYLLNEFCPKLSQGTGNELEQQIKNLNARIQGSPLVGYRTEPICVVHILDLGERTRILNNVKLNGSLEERNAYSSITRKVAIHGGLGKAAPYFDESERNVLRKVMFLPVLPHEIEPEMKRFIAQLKQQLHDTSDIFEVAAYAHMKLTQIHPFFAANGRTARALMNGILMRAGKKPLVFFSDKEYTAAVKHADKDNASFVQYLRDKEQHMRKLVEKNWQGTMCDHCRKEPATAKCS